MLAPCELEHSQICGSIVDQWINCRQLVDCHILLCVLMHEIIYAGWFHCSLLSVCLSTAFQLKNS